MNKETLQEYNGKLEENNVSLTNVLTTINNLPTASGGGSSDIYSLEETVIGTWLGKPLYRKVISFQKSDFINNTVHLIHNISDIDVVVTQKCNWYDSAATRWRTIPSNYYSTMNWSTQLSTAEEFITFELGNSALERIRNSATYIYVVLEYTKTTD